MTCLWTRILIACYPGAHIRGGITYRTALLGAFVLALHAIGVQAQETGSWPRIVSWGVNAGFGAGDRSGVKYYSLLPHLDLSLPRIVDEPLARYNLRAQWVLEPFVSYATNSVDTYEAGANLLFFSLRYDRGQRVVPFIAGGEGALYTGLRDHGLGTHFQFSSQFGAGLEWFITRSTALSVTYRYRHISNAGLSSQNTGLNAHFGLLGLSYFPRR